MVQMTEFRVVMPLSLEEYELGHLYSVTKMEMENTNGSEGVEVLVNENFSDEKMGKGRYTHKIYRLASKVPSWVSAIAPSSALQLEEKSWNAFPHIKTELTCPYFSSLKLTVESIHLPDTGSTENALQLSQEALEMRHVDFVDVAETALDWWSYVIPGAGLDLAATRSQKTGRGPLLPGWQTRTSPIMTAYKLVTVNVPYWGWGTRAEKTILSGERALFLESHKKIFGWMDEWCDVTMGDVRRMESDNAASMREILHNHENVRQEEITEAVDDKGTAERLHVTCKPLTC